MAILETFWLLGRNVSPEDFCRERDYKMVVNSVNQKLARLDEVSAAPFCLELWTAVDEVPPAQDTASPVALPHCTKPAMLRPDLQCRTCSVRSSSSSSSNTGSQRQCSAGWRGWMLQPHGGGGNHTTVEHSMHALSTAPMHHAPSTACMHHAPSAARACTECSTEAPQALSAACIDRLWEAGTTPSPSLAYMDRAAARMRRA